jgi:hypothetical protein
VYKSLLSGLAVAAVLIAAGAFFGPKLGALALPALRVVVELLAPDFLVKAITIVQQDGQWLVRLDAETGAWCFAAGHHIPPGMSMNATTLLGHALQHPVLIFALIAGWPGIAPSVRGMALLPAVLALAVVECADVPFVLVGSVWDLINANFAPNESGLLVHWMNFMNGGGRLALSLAAGATALSLAQFLDRQVHAAPRTVSMIGTAK